MPATREPRQLVSDGPAAASGRPASEPQPTLDPPKPEDSDFDDEITDVHTRSPAGQMSTEEQFPKERAVVIRMDGPLAGEVIDVGNKPLSFGRHPDNRVRLDDPGISRFHARVVTRGGRHFVENLGSRNGVFVHGERVEHTELNDGEWLQLGARSVFRFSILERRQEQLLRTLFESSTRDGLTGAFNRRHFEDRLQAELAFARRHSVDASLLALDLDHFKQVNDTYGHPAGDAVLRQVANALRSRLRTEDVLARVGGEEFAVILRGIAPPGAARAGERLRATVAAMAAIWSGRPLPVTVSIGCASLSECSAASSDELIKLADQRLYRAKHTGRNRVVGHD